MSEPFDVSVSPDEALVLFEWLSELDTSKLNAAEMAAVNALTAALERRLVAPFQPNYQELLAAARSRLTDVG